jgi:hypothetical protein
VPANHKWFRNLAVAQTLIDVLEPDRKRREEEAERHGQENLKAIRSSLRPGAV